MNNLSPVFFYLLPAIPLVLRLILIGYFHSYASEVLEEAERDSESGRVLTLTMTGFSFSAFFVLLVTNPTFVEKGIDIELSIYYILISVIGFMSSFSVEAYKHRRWQQQLCHGLEDVGRFSLYASVAALMWVSAFNDGMKILVLLAGGVSWGLDYVNRLYMWYEFLKTKQECDSDG